MGSHPFHIRDMHTRDKPAILELARSLTKFFPQDVIDQIGAAIAKHAGLVGVIDDDIIGFLIYAIRDPQTAEIIWMGVDEEYHGLGLGSLLVDTLEGRMEKEDVQKLIASTLSYTVKYKPYEKVRSFYYHRGFTSLGIQENYYEDGLDRLILIKTLR